MDIVYEKEVYTFNGNEWVDSGEKNVSEIFSNFLCLKAIDKGANPSLFGGVLTEKRSRPKKKKKVAIKAKKSELDPDSLEAQLKRGIKF